LKEGVKGILVDAALSNSSRDFSRSSLA